MLFFALFTILSCVASAFGNAVPCQDLSLLNFPGIEILSVQSTEVLNYSSVDNPSIQPPVSGLNFCNVSITLTHPGAFDTVLVGIWLPIGDWNGRWQSTGGGGLAAGYFDTSLAPVVAAGYAAASTDAGLTLNGTINPQTGLWAIQSNGSLNNELIKNFAYRSIHEMTVIGKAVTAAFYGCPARYSYYGGCSTGGRQGYFAAHLYPEDFDGIMANSPAINTPQISPADFWPSVVMKNIVAPNQCVFSAYQNATIAACDPLDGAIDGLISDPNKCHFNTSTLVGSKVACNGESFTITSADAEVVAKILRGATTTSGQFLWFGNPPGAPFSGLANTTTINGSIVPVPFSAAEFWIENFVYQNPSFDAADMTFADFDNAFSMSVTEFTSILGTDHPDLSAFQKSGGKLITFHGMADQLITHWGTTLYRDRLDRKMGGTNVVDEFYRLFLAPGVYHCGGGYGPVPTDPFGALVKWVESGEAPATLAASVVGPSGANVTRNLCRYPQLLTYKGGDVDVASSFTCQ